MYDNERSGFVYVIQDGSGLCKIGRAKDVQKRLRTLATAASSELTLVASWLCDDASGRESTLHQEWSEARVRGEWFRIPEEVVAAWRQGETQEQSRGLSHRHRAAAKQRAERIWKALPEPDGVWWISDKGQWITCPRCDERFRDRPGVMCYVEGNDTGGIVRATRPAWIRDGWAVWREHERCGWHDWKSETATLRQIKSWSIGPWRAMGY